MMSVSKGQRNHYEFDVVIDGIALPEETVTGIDEALQKAAAAAIASLDLRGKELVISPIMAGMISDPRGDGDGDGPAGGAQIAIRPVPPDMSRRGRSTEEGITPFATRNLAVFRSKLASTKASGAEAVRVSLVKGDLHLEQLDPRGHRIVRFVLHPITSSAKKVTAGARKVAAVEITRMDSSGESSMLRPRDRAALAAIVDELSQIKESGAPGVVFFWDDFWQAVDAGIACGLAAVEGGANPIADAGCAVAAGIMLGGDDEDDDE